MATADSDVLVVGAGISGLTTAFRLSLRGINVQVIEAAAHAGGVIQTVRRDGVLYERGPNSILETNPHIGELIDQLDLRGQRIEISARSSKRFVVHRGTLVPLPMSPAAFVSTPLFSTGAKFRLLREPFASRGPAESEESVADFVVRRVGREFLDYAVEPFVAGIYAGDPRELSLPAAFPRLHALEQRYGSLIVGRIRGARERAKRPEKGKNVARSFSFANGLQTLTDALAARVGRLRLETRATHIRRGMSGCLTVATEGNGSSEELRARAVVLAVPARQAALLVRDFAPGAAQALDAIPYAPVVSVASVYRRADVAHALDGFGVLAPRIEQRRILGTLFSSTMFEGRAPQDHVMLTTFLGGQREPALPSLPDTDLANIVHAELAALIGARAAPHSWAVTRWPHAIPQYTIGHLDRVRTALTAESALPGLFPGGSWRGGISVGDCIASACQTADRVSDRLQQAATIRRA